MSARYVYPLLDTAAPQIIGGLNVLAAAVHKETTKLICTRHPPDYIHIVSSARTYKQHRMYCNTAAQKKLSQLNSDSNVQLGALPMAHSSRMSIISNDTPVIANMQGQLTCYAVRRDEKLVAFVLAYPF